MSKTIIFTPGAPAVIGTYSQAVRVGNMGYLPRQRLWYLSSLSRGQG